jgi:RimJ/RimL family protein N-acetyltransferase
MLRLRPFKQTDTTSILSWCQDETTFYQWTAGRLGDYPITEDQFRFNDALMPFVAFDDDGIVGFFTLRTPNNNPDELRFGFVIVDPAKRGKSYGKFMLQLGIKFAFELYGAQKVSLGVFENNLPAYYCYKAAGFQDVTLDTMESYSILDEEWYCKELVLEKR